jgi:hypothetical protein
MFLFVPYTKTSYHEFLVVHHCRYFNHRLGPGRICLPGKRYYTYTIGNGRYCHCTGYCEKANSNIREGIPVNTFV